MAITAWPFQTNIRLSSYVLTMCFQGHGQSQRPFAFLRLVYIGETQWALPALTKMLHNHLRLSGDCMQQTSQLINWWKTHARLWHVDRTRPGLTRAAFRDLLFPAGLSAAYYDSQEVLILRNSPGTKQAPVSSITQHAVEPTALALGPPLLHVESDALGVRDCWGAEMFAV